MPDESTSGARNLLRRMFGRPEGLLGRLGGAIMARTNRACAALVIDELDVRPNERVLEIGFGPGVAVALAAARADQGHVAGVDASAEMLKQATARNAAAVRAGRVELRTGTAERLPFADDSFDKALAINSMQLWPDAPAGLRELRRVLKGGGRLVLAFTPQSGQGKDGLDARVAGAGLADVQVVQRDGNVLVLAKKP